MAVFGLIVAACAALSVHLIDGTASADTRSISPRTIVNAVNLRASDLPGFQVKPDSSAGGGGTLAQSLVQCVGPAGEGLNTTPQAQVAANFTSGSGLGSAGVSSFVIVTSDAQVASDSKVLGDPRFGRCMARLLSTAISADGATVAASNPQAMTLPDPPVARGSAVRSPLALRLSVTLTGDGLSTTAWVDFYFVTVGRDEIFFGAYTLDQPFSLAAEHRIARVLVSRALALPH
ncbi:MAG: hypothetical protein ACRDLP_12790 [Solirubrobacteraceae bacterium]